MMLKGSIQQEDITLVNIYVPNTGAPNYIKQTVMDIKVTVTVQHFNTVSSSTARSSRKKIKKETVAINGTLGQIDLIVIFRTFNPKATEHILFSSARGTFFRIDHMLGHKTSLNKFMKIEIISTIFSDHTGMKLEINYNKKTETHTNTWKLNNMLLNNECFNNEIKGKIKRYFATNENENTTTQNGTHGYGTQPEQF